ncbi:MAG: AbrB/MazE/SpoVT family DNA-binding domain-containing protein [Vicinamibacteria bacterium]|nr:AbrB/MazE/SpoVT family DNA-binding domain-containing protein [Vicinamibacteria bacterium]
MPTATLSSKGQITLPRQVRQALGVTTGDRVAFTVEASGEIRVRAATDDVRSLKGLLPRPRRAVSLAEMDAAIARRGRRR